MRESLLEKVTWPVVVETNRLLCLPKGAYHGPTSDGHDRARELWEANHRRPLSLFEAVELCRKCHRLAPFCNYNGNTFVAIIRRIIGNLGLPPTPEAVLRSVACRAHRRGYRHP
jgi:hypothetical protein